MIGQLSDDIVPRAIVNTAESGRIYSKSPSGCAVTRAKEADTAGTARSTLITGPPDEPNATKALVIGSIRAEEANLFPQWYRKKFATPFSHCSLGT
jgi:hypothetical protein